jgi:RsiW-degrading membrane proteinase PrsW (M82 family)
MTRVGKHSGARSEPVALPRRRLLGLALGITLTLVAWGFLVWAAIDFGAKARGGQTPAWVFLGLATLGATACLFLTLILGSKVVTAMRREPVERPPAIPGGRRAAR